MEKKSVSVRGGAAPLLMMLTTVIVVLLASPGIVHKAAEVDGVKRPKIAATIEGELVYKDYAHAAALLKAGDAEGARKIIDNNQEASLAILPTSATSGPLGNLSAAALLITLGKAMAHQAVQVAWDGDKDAAAGWVSRCRLLSNQALFSASPTVEGLQLAGALDRIALETEGNIRFALGDTEGAMAMNRRLATFDGYWRSQILQVVTDKRHEWDELCLPVTGKPLPAEAQASQERQFAAVITARYREARRRMQFV